MSSIQEDYLLRMMQQAILFIQRVLGMAEAGKRAEARQDLDQAWEKLLGLPRGVAHRLDSPSLLRLLGAERAQVAAALLEAEARLCFMDGEEDLGAQILEKVAELRKEGA